MVAPKKTPAAQSTSKVKATKGGKASPPKKVASLSKEPLSVPQERKTVGKPKVEKADLKTKPIPKIRIRLSAFDHTVLDEAVTKIIETAERSGAVIHGPVPLPTQIRKFTLMRSTFVKKDARDQFEMRIHRRLIDLTETTFKTVDALQSLSLPNGVDVEIKMG